MGTGKLNKQELVMALFTRPNEPIFIPKGDKGIVFDVMTGDILAEKFKPIKESIRQRFFTDGNVVALSQFDDNEAPLPDLSKCIELARHAKFSVFIPQHQKQACELIKIFLGRKTFEDFISTAVYAHDQVNPALFVHAFSVALLNRPDTNKLHVPTLHEIFPSTFVDAKKLHKAKVYTQLFPEHKRPPLTIPKDWTANDLDFEHRLAYFREDVGLNSHHWHWHLVYPFNCPKEILNKDRRGELFYYMHHQLVGRYNFERLCNNLARVTRYFQFQDAIDEGYFPKIDQPLGIRGWAGRHARSKLYDLRREKEKNVFDLEDLRRWKNRIIEAIHLRRVVNEQGEEIQLDEKTGIDILGNIVEACPTLSKNYPLYGDLHNYGHLAIALCHDPDNRYLEEVSVMGIPETAARDPVFYRWHAFIDYIFELHKNTLTPYTPSELDFQGIRIKEVTVETCGDRQKLYTYMERVNIDVSHGLDFSKKHGSVFVTIDRLQYTPFKYHIQVENRSGVLRVGTVRIFLAPKYDERGKKMLFIDQKRLFIELDKFVAKFSKNGTAINIERNSTDSSVTLKNTLSFAEITKQPVEDDGTPEATFCGCGWPQNLLIPKGRHEGYPCQLFVMISKYEDDSVPVVQSDGECSESNAYCGARNKKYPDRRAMGFPFDRPARDGVDTLQKFLTPNMSVTDVSIFFKGDGKPFSGAEGTGTLSAGREKCQ